MEEQNQQEISQPIAVRPHWTVFLSLFLSLLYTFVMLSIACNLGPLATLFSTSSLPLLVFAVPFLAVMMGLVGVWQTPPPLWQKGRRLAVISLFFGLGLLVLEILLICYTFANLAGG
uniref:Uncharacterized protein n=1 Tax=Thermosporothrix sp. COM3 TaxID=2490863 RepID=A0A455STZ1_9CHLR|nr:hypothetical protein KTC_51230 [Thermosporothrix sp. COM3]